MADPHGKHHDYHLVNPSWWPFVGAIAAFVTAVGAITWMHGAPSYVLVIGFAMVLYTMFMWWRDIIIEAHAGDHTPVVSLHLRYGMLLFIVSEVMFFVAWFWAFFDASLFAGEANLAARVAATGGIWPPKGTTVFDPFHLPLLNTMILLTSGTTVTWAHHALLGNDRKGLVWGLGITIILGMIFTCVQAYEYAHAAFAFSNANGGNIYGSTFFMATGFHGFHVVVGTIFLFICWLRALKGDFTPKQHFGFEAAAWYWHFVDVVWLFLFVCIYIWGNHGGMMPLE
ncbi:cytochrome c oxidase subunit 3 [Aestuariivirga litoralis]|uniref:cytochrome c oxidase subunit 3 n=1 Tax=Aestuariivirga litoralis TaxID=2650924 RepID=UPI0018C67FD4|nr:cytochrome c oxidase subunit 3 [Aestuariivirga litoralis]MBG1233420.1 cytochrome c oxidase subunit 3 [Aestuariivirga litoralis]